MDECPREPRRASERIKRAAAITRSSASRYPRQLYNSLRYPEGAPLSAAAAFQVPREFDGPLALSWLGHSTVLLHLGGMWVLTDPVFSHRIGVRLGKWTIGVERLVNPHARPEELPPIDLILISHAHFDHLDRPSLKQLESKATVVVTSAKTRRLIPRGFGDVVEVHWEEEVEVRGLRIAAMRPAHWGARTAWDKHRGYNSYILTSPQHRVLYAGDTALTDAYTRVGETGGVELSIFGIGAYDPWISAHASPEQVWQMHRQAGGRWLLPVHHSTFKLSNEPVDEPLQRLLAAAGEGAQSIIVHEPGTLWTLPG